MKEIKKIDPMSMGKVMGGIYGLFGLLVAALMLCFASSLSSAVDSSAGASALFGGGILSLIFLPIFYGIAGLIGGIITAWIYNVVAGYTGGLMIELSDAKE